MEYYFNGCISWQWYYPYHYTPFLNDLSEVLETFIIDRNDPQSPLKVPPQFVLGEPFKPFEQLVAVLPVYSCRFLPKIFHHLFDSSSPISHFYPKEVTIDNSRKGPEWTNKVLLPFIDENLLVGVVKPLFDKLDDREKKKKFKQ